MPHPVHGARANGPFHSFSTSSTSCSSTILSISAVTPANNPQSPSMLLGGLLGIPTTNNYPSRHSMSPASIPCSLHDFPSGSRFPLDNVVSCLFLPLNNQAVVQVGFQPFAQLWPRISTSGKQRKVSSPLSNSAGASVTDID